MRRLLLPSLLIILLAIVFGPAVLTAGWHLRHGRTVVCAERTFFVPLRWYARVESRKVYISRLSPTVLSSGPASAIISLWPEPIPPKSDAERDHAYQTFATGYRAYLAGNDGLTRGPIVRGTGNKQSICMESSIEKAQKWIAISCLAYGGAWNATFYGDEKNADAFLCFAKIKASVKSITYKETV